MFLLARTIPRLEFGPKSTSIYVYEQNMTITESLKVKKEIVI